MTTKENFPRNNPVMHMKLKTFLNHARSVHVLGRQTPVWSVGHKVSC